MVVQSTQLLPAVPHVVLLPLFGVFTHVPFLSQHPLQLHEEQLAAQKAKIEAAAARFGEMDDYYILDEVTVYFANGKVKVDPKYEAPLVELATKARDVQGYVIEVTGHASSAGSTEVNQKL